MKSVFAVAASLICVAGSSVACGSSVDPTDPFALSIPALWASPDGATAGVEFASISARPDRIPGWSVNLADERANGAGEAWIATTAEAAVLGTVFAPANAATVSLAYDVTGPINGPSAGGLFTVATIASLRGVSLVPGVTMTGTIGMDGSIGPVDSVPQKVQAASDAGFTKILVPASVDAGSIAPLDGVQVVPVTSLEEAYGHLTDRPLFDSYLAPTFMPASATGPNVPAGQLAAAGAEFSSAVLRELDQRTQAGIAGPQEVAGTIAVTAWVTYTTQYADSADAATRKQGTQAQPSDTEEAVADGRAALGLGPRLVQQLQMLAESPVNPQTLDATLDAQARFALEAATATQEYLAYAWRVTGSDIASDPVLSPHADTMNAFMRGNPSDGNAQQRLSSSWATWLSTIAANTAVGNYLPTTAPTTGLAQQLLAGLLAHANTNSPGGAEGLLKVASQAPGTVERPDPLFLGAVIIATSLVASGAFDTPQM